MPRAPEWGSTSRQGQLSGNIPHSLLKTLDGLFWRVLWFHPKPSFFLLTSIHEAALFLGYNKHSCTLGLPHFGLAVPCQALAKTMSSVPTWLKMKLPSSRSLPPTNFRCSVLACFLLQRASLTNYGFTSYSGLPWPQQSILILKMLQILSKRFSMLIQVFRSPKVYFTPMLAWAGPET